MHELFQRNYNAIVARNLITDKTTIDDFYFKAKEELKEVSQAIVLQDKENEIEEWADLLNVCASALIFQGVNLEEILTKIAEKNEKRKKIARFRSNVK